MEGRNKPRFEESGAASTDPLDSITHEDLQVPPVLTANTLFAIIFYT